MADKLKDRISLLVEAEARAKAMGKSLKPEAQAELDSYRQSGALKTGADGGAALTENQSKDTNFYMSSLGANRDFEASGTTDGPGYAGDAARAVLPGNLVNSNTSVSRQRAQQAKEDFIRASLRLESGAAIGPSEFLRQDRIFFPQTGDSKEVLDQKASARARLIEGFRIGSGPGAARVDAYYEKAGAPVSPDPPAGGNGTTPPPLVGDPARPATSAPIFDAMNAGAYGRTNGPETIDTEFKGVDNPELRAKNEQVLAAVSANQPDEQVLALAQRLGVDPAVSGLNSILAYRKKTGLLKYADTTDYQTKVPLTSGEKVVNKIVASPVTEFVGEAGNAAAAGIPQAIAVGIGGEDMQRKLQAAENTSPRAAIAGKLVGTVAGAAGTELAATRLLAGTRLAAQGARIGDATYGAVSGATDNPDDPVMGAVKGAADNLAGGEIGRAVIGGVASAVSPTGGKYADLYANGGRPTLGQRAADAGEPGSMARFAGGAFNNLEQIGTSFPVSGFAVRGARGDAMASWERAGINRSLKEIGEPPLPKNVATGSEAFTYAGPKFEKIYDQARAGMQFAPDGQFAKDAGAWQAQFKSGALSGEQEAQVEKLIRSQIGSRLQNGGGILTGENYKLATSALADAAETADSPAVKTAIKEYNDIVKAAARRVSDPEAVKLMDKADKGWAFYKPLALAASRAGSEPGRFTPVGVAAEERLRFGGSQKYIEGNTKLNEYVQRGMAMRDTLPNTGTADRVMAGQVIGTGVAGGATAATGPTIPIAATALTAPYLPGVRNLTAGIMAPRTNLKLVSMADRIRAQYQAGGGPTGQGLLDAYLEQRRMQNQPGIAGAYR